MATVLNSRSADVQESIDMLHGVHKGGRILAPEEQEAQSKIMELLKHRGYTVWKMSDEQVREAVVLLTSSDEQVRKAAAKVFSKMGPTASKAVAEQLSNADPGVRAVAAELIGYMGKKAAEAHLEDLVKLLEDENGVARRAGVAALGSLGELGQCKVAAIAKLLKDPDTDVRRLAVEALRRIEPTGQEHVQAILCLLVDPAWTVRRSAVETLGSMQEAAVTYSSQIAVLFHDPEWLVRGAAAQAIGSLGEGGAKHAAEIQELLGDKEWFVRNVAAEALHSMGPTGYKLLEIHHEGMRSSAAEQLAARFHPPKKIEVTEPAEMPSEEEKDKNAGGLRAPKTRRGRMITSRSAQKAVYAHSQPQDEMKRDAAAAQFNPHSSTNTKKMGKRPDED
eukprot:gnl/MRDRNA2_/MRDRNA2_135762_c0_seq1.p1 gnl/MRDRNA2_/MRDRNA2_135762_c0~~gnl/MRDRNA2_/MRDRNA2_135762_c0_seq1.p1  ORF type:complete len:392 (+),score=99.20 gnl/MRDRNA2_/MRDRNA2_135762_c0_seq1:94-1269(+)